jgi:predicted ATPase
MAVRGTILRGWALAAQGQAEQGALQMRQSMAAWQATGAEAFQPYFLALLAERHGEAGEREEGLSVLAKALALVHKNGEHFYEAELYRLNGELLLNDKRRMMNAERQTSKTHSPQQAIEAEAFFQQALDIAQQQQAKSWELRAATSMARLWQQQGRTAEARALLAPVYNWFTEGFDTADLKDAKALLTERA